MSMAAMQRLFSYMRSSAIMLAAMFVPAAGLAHAQSYPSRPIKIIVPFAPGGVGDILARMLAGKLGEAGRTVLVENRAGGAGVIGADMAARSPPDGYTLYMGFHGTQAILPHLQAKLPYDAARDFAPIIFIATSPNILIVHPSVPAHSPQELVAYIKAHPGEVSYGSQGVGSSGHLVAEQFKLIHGLDIVPVHYRGAAPALQDLVAGHVQMMFDIVLLTKAQIAAGKMRALAVTAAKREPSMPDVPTMAETGMPGIEAGPWFGLFAPAGTPRPAIDWVNAETRKVFSAPDIRSRLEGQGLTLPLGSPEDFAAHVAAEYARWGEVIRRGNIKLE